MCWKSYDVCMRKSIAEENIPIFKVCEYSLHPNSVRSYFHNFLYELNKVYSLGEELFSEFNTDTECLEIDAGFHSYSTSICTIAQSEISIRVLVKNNDDAYLASYLSYYSCKVNGYIPKGAKYYVNKNGEYVSDSICLTEVEKL